MREMHDGKKKTTTTNEVCMVRSKLRYALGTMNREKRKTGHNGGEFIKERKSTKKDLKV